MDDAPSEAPKGFWDLTKEDRDRPWYQVYPVGHPLHETTAAFVDLFSQMDPSTKCRFIWMQVFPSVPWSAAAVGIWLESEHTVPRSKVHEVEMAVVLKLLQQKQDPLSHGRMKRRWLSENLELTEKQFESIRTKNLDRVHDAGGGGRGPWQFRKSLCREFGLNCPEFPESSP
jgi:hypothetical protein